MNSLFSTFDPHSYLSLSLFWVSGLLYLLWAPYNFWSVKPGALQIMKQALSNLKMELHMAVGAWSHTSLLTLPLVLFTLICANNSLGLIPYVFTASSHLTLSLSLAAPLWVGHFFMAWVKLPTSMLAHLVPTGTPVALMPFMVVIEMISALIRPITLSVRLAANMMAGHLLFTLITQGAPHSSAPLVGLILAGAVALGVLETAVSFIQAYVFSVLSTLYLSEVNSPNLSYPIKLKKLLIFKIKYAELVIRMADS